MVLIRSVSGVRGLVGRDLTVELAEQYGAAFARLAGGDVAVGRDARPGGENLAAAVSRGLCAGGVTVHDLGVAPTPTVGIAVRLRRLAGGIAVTASHNPEAYNGLKFFSSRGIFLDREAADRLFSAVDRGVSGASHAGSVVSSSGAARDHIDRVVACRLVDRSAIARRRPVLVVDCVNAAGSLVLPPLLRKLGCDVVELHTDVGGGFPRGAEPVPEHLGDLSAAVVRHRAHGGLACDPDADRLALVDESGLAIGEEYTLAIASRVVLERTPGPIVANVSTSRMMDDLAAEFGVGIHRSAVGEINVVSKMMEVSAVVGGEGNGGVILPGIHAGRDAATAAALVATAIAENGGIASLASRFRRYCMVKEKLETDHSNRAEMADAVRRAFPGGALDTTDGAKIAWPDRWVHVRMSGTEPVTRLIAEAEREEDALALVAKARAALGR